MPEQEAAPAAEKPKTRASRVMPKVGYRLHFIDGNVWLNTEATDYDGLIIGQGGGARERMIDDAIDTLAKCLTALKKARARG